MDNGVRCQMTRKFSLDEITQVLEEQAFLADLASSTNNQMLRDKYHGFAVKLAAAASILREQQNWMLRFREMVRPAFESGFYTARSNPGIECSIAWDTSESAKAILPFQAIRGLVP